MKRNTLINPHKLLLSQLIERFFYVDVDSGTFRGTFSCRNSPHCSFLLTIDYVARVYIGKAINRA